MSTGPNKSSIVGGALRRCLCVPQTLATQAAALAAAGAAAAAVIATDCVLADALMGSVGRGMATAVQQWQQQGRRRGQEGQG